MANKNKFIVPVGKAATALCKGNPNVCSVEDIAKE
jgi:hypothetical protein